MGRKNGNKSSKRKVNNRPPRHDESFYGDYRSAFEKYEKYGDNVQIFNTLKYKNESQKLAHDEIKKNVLTFITGPAGSAKTFIAVAEAVQQLASGRIKKIILSRPTVEAGPSLGFLPGDMKAKIDPYLIPLYDNLEYFLEEQQLKDLIEAGKIKIEPIQYLRGRTINDAFIILDETQNATKEELRLVLTRIGENTKCVVTYDMAQIDLKGHKKTESCGFDIDNKFRYTDKKGIGFFAFTAQDIVRSAIVQLILEVYEETN